MNERGYTVCRNGKLKKGPEATGGTHNVVVNVTCPAGSKPRALFHTHPGGNIRPSPQDLITAQQHNLPVCVKAQGKVRCYRPKQK